MDALEYLMCEMADCKKVGGGNSTSRRGGGNCKDELRRTLLATNPVANEWVLLMEEG